MRSFLLRFSRFRYVTSKCLYVESRGFILVVIDILISLARVLSLSLFLSVFRVASLARGSGSIGEKYENSFLSVDTPVPDASIKRSFGLSRLINTPLARVFHLDVEALKTYWHVSADTRIVVDQ